MTAGHRNPRAPKLLLALCTKTHHIRQMKPTPIPLTVRLPKSLHAWLVREAKRRHRSLNSMVIALLANTAAGKVGRLDA